MPIFIGGRWLIAHAILLTKKARYIVPAVIATVGATVGGVAVYLVEKWRKKGKGGKGEREQTEPLPERKST